MDGKEVSAGSGLDLGSVGRQMHQFMTELFPICRSITGDGLRATLRAIAQRIPLDLHEVATGTQVFDWTVPSEWNIRDAYIKNSRGERVVDFNESNLHVVNYSAPVSARMQLSELKEHLFTLPERPDWIPYRTSYYKETWGFCLRERQLRQLEEDEYDVCIDSSLGPGSLTYGEWYLQGSVRDEVLISCHCCHPSLANDNLSGIALSTFLAKHLSSAPRRYSYRFLFIPGTIGSIAWLSINEDKVGHVKHGLVVTCVGDSGPSTYKRSRRGDAEIDRAASHVLQHRGAPYQILDFSPYGYDERQYSSPGFNLPVGSLMRTPNGRYPEYHTSADDLNFVSAEWLADSLDKYVAVIDVLEGNKRYRNLNPKCEPQLGKRGLYRMMGGKDAEVDQLALLWVLNLSDGDHSLLDIAERSGLAFRDIERAAEALIEHDLLEPL